jgi:hypothetical protein
VGHVVAAVLNVLELADAVIDMLEIFQGLLKQACAIAEVTGHFGEHIKKFSVSGDKANHVGRSSPVDSAKEWLKSTEKYRMQ